MSNIGRNDLCPCGSGKKYKKCCLNASTTDMIEVWKSNAEEILAGNIHSKELITICFKMLDIMEKLDWQGGCHAISSIMHILFKEVGVDNELCIGEVKSHLGVFDHSWIEVNNKVYDLSIVNCLEGIKVSNPIINGYNIGTKKEPTVSYGGSRMYAKDVPAFGITSIPFVLYLDSLDFYSAFDTTGINDLDGIYDASQEGLWGFITLIGKEVGLDLNVDELRRKYNSTKRVER